MSRELLVRAGAEEDIANAYRWYEERCPGLGRQFLLALEATFSRVRDWPEMFPVVHREARRAPVSQFPYRVIYRISDDRLVVIAVYHSHQDPRSWQTRT
jgi:toxin ParE1/3/4